MSVSPEPYKREYSAPIDEPPKFPDQKRVIDHNGLLKPTPEEKEIQDEISYDITEEANFPLTRALFIGNLTRPINSVSLQQHLKDIAAPYVLERAWLNRMRTHAIILFNEAEGAKIVREKLNGVKYPDSEEEARLAQEIESETKEAFVVERKPLFIDFIPVKAINQWIFEEDRGPRIGKWRFSFEKKDGEVFANHKLLNGGFVPRYDPSIRRGARRGGRRNGHRDNYRDSYHPREREPRDRPLPRGYDRYQPKDRETDSYHPRERQTDSYHPQRKEPERTRSRSRSRSPRRY